MERKEKTEQEKKDEILQKLNRNMGAKINPVSGKVEHDLFTFKMTWLIYNDLEYMYGKDHNEKKRYLKKYADIRTDIIIKKAVEIEPYWDMWSVEWILDKIAKDIINNAKKWIESDIEC